MKSPFPGMDPFIEACDLWEDFHHHVIHEIHRAVALQLPQGYVLRIRVRRYIGLTQWKGKDVNEEFKESFLEIYALHEERTLVTCIEMPSPSNKRPDTEGWKQYERKRQAMLLGQANFIEIDLVRGGHKMPMLTPWPDSPYSLLVCGTSKAPYCYVWPAKLQRRLPVIPVPLLAPDADLSLDLQPLVDDCYSVGRYSMDIDYTQPLIPELPDEDAAWVRDLLNGR